MPKGKIELNLSVFNKLPETIQKQVFNELMRKCDMFREASIATLTETKEEIRVEIENHEIQNKQGLEFEQEKSQNPQKFKW